MRVRLKHRVLARHLARSRLSQNGWAQRLGLDSGHLSKLVNGRRPYPGPATREKLLDGLELPFETLFEIEHRRRQVPPRRSSDQRGSWPLAGNRRVNSEPSRGFAMSVLRDDLKYAFRTLTQRPGFALVAILTLTLGIGVNTAIFSVVDQVLLQPLPYPSPERLVMIWGHHTQIGRETASLPDYLDWREQAGSFDKMAAIRLRGQTLTGVEQPMRVIRAAVASDFFQIFGSPIAAGRDFTPDEDIPGQGQVAIVSHAFWQEKLGGRDDIIGTRIRLNEVPLTVIGIAEAGFNAPQYDGLNGVDLWTPLALDPADFGRRSDFLRVVARLAPGVSMKQADDEMKAVMARLEQQYPGTNTDWSAEVISLEEQLVGNVRGALWTILGAVGFVLLIACANVANLMLARSSGRQREVAVRAALGAGRVRIIRQLLTESLLLSVAGGMAGLLAGFWLVRGLVSFGPPLPRLDEPTLSLSVLLFAAGASVLTGLLFGLAPVLQLCSLRLADSLREGGRGDAATTGGRLRSLLVVAEVSLTLVLLVGAGLMLRSFQQLLSVDPGFSPRNVITFRVSLPPASYPERTQRRDFFDRLLAETAALPGVAEAAAISDVPLEGVGSVLTFAVQGRPPVPNDVVQDAEIMVATSNYFQTLEIPLLEGEYFPESAGQQRLALINQTARKKYWPDSSPIGERVTLSDPETGPWFRIVGVVGDTHQERLDRQPHAQIYASQQQLPQSSLALVLRTEANLEELAGAIRGRVRQLDASLPGVTVRTLDEVVARSVDRPRFSVYAIAAFGALSLLLAVVGIYGVISYAVNRRVHEIGVRVTLGASRARILRLVVRQGMTLVAAGLIIGLIGARFLTSVLEELLFGVSATDPVVFGAMTLLLAAVAFVACVLPARRASSLDPLQALRVE